MTAEMLVHQDVDDEATLEEEEASTKPEDVQEELAGLEQVPFWGGGGGGGVLSCVLECAYPSPYGIVGFN